MTLLGSASKKYFTVRDVNGGKRGGVLSIVRPTEYNRVDIFQERKKQFGYGEQARLHSVQIQGAQYGTHLLLKAVVFSILWNTLCFKPLATAVLYVHSWPVIGINTIQRRIDISRPLKTEINHNVKVGAPEYVYRQ